MYLLTPYWSCVYIILFSQIKNVENKTSTTAIPLSSSLSSGSTSSSKTSPTVQNGATATQKPQTTTYRAFTTTYRSTASTRSYINYANRSDKLTELDRLRMREEFYATYDVMTGIRIAATLGGFFFLMVFLIVYKSRSHSAKALNVSVNCLNLNTLYFKKKIFRRIQGLPLKQQQQYKKKRIVSSRRLMRRQHFPYIKTSLTFLNCLTSISIAIESLH